MIERSTQIRFADFTVDLVRRRVTQNDEPLALTAKAFDTLCVLLRNSGETVSKQELMNAVWDNTAVEENNLTQQISALRKAFRERPDDHRFIVTVPGSGYSFVAAIEDEAADDENRRTRPWDRHLSSGARRGFALAAAYILLVASSFLFQGRQPAHGQSLAVVDFRTTSTNDEIIGTGISDTLRAKLGSVQDLVIRPESVGPQDDAIALGRDLKVDTVVTGSVQRDHERIRVAVQMVDVRNGRIVWGKTFDAVESNVFALQDSIAGEVAKALNVDISRRHSTAKLKLLPA